MCSVSQVFYHSSNGKAGQAREVQHHLVDITPAPVLASLKGFHDGMSRIAEMLRRMFVFGGIAASDVSTRQTEPQMDPCITRLEALFAALCSWCRISIPLMGALFHGVHV